MDGIELILTGEELDLLRQIMGVSVLILILFTGIISVVMDSLTVSLNYWMSSKKERALYRQWIIDRKNLQITYKLALYHLKHDNKDKQ